MHSLTKNGGRSNLETLLPMVPARGSAAALSKNSREELPAIATPAVESPPKPSAVRKLLARQLEPDEVSIVLDVLKAERSGKTYTAGRLGFVESLIRRRWLCRHPDDSITISDEVHRLLSESRGGEPSP
jgi:hypothetical protein